MTPRELWGWPDCGQRKLPGGWCVSADRTQEKIKQRQELEKENLGQIKTASVHVLGQESSLYLMLNGRTGVW